MQTLDDLTTERLLAIARQRAGLDEFGNDKFMRPLTVLLQAMREEAQLTQAGLRAQSERLINALVNRLRRTRFVHDNPSVLDEDVKVAAVIVGLPRTGSTMLQRLLAAAPSLTATCWWETIYPMPLPGEDPNSREARITLAEQLVAQILASADNFASIHPMDARAYDEELTLIEHSFMSNMPESMMYVPSYGQWLLQADQTWAYQELILYLKILQFQHPRRRQQHWVLKSPHHLTAVDTLLQAFPAAQVIMTHRPITAVMPSWYSMVGALSKADSAAEGLQVAQAKHWTWRLDKTLQGFIAARAGNESRFTDIGYRQLLSDPLAACSRILESAGLALNEGDRAALSQHLQNNQRDQRPSHQYDLADYGMTQSTLEEQFGYYTQAYRAFLM
ncbi:MAG: sulfotransferase [Gammaproteobacteria bacterium]|nr:sulfotransferase [Gammaproteobacteria bacterium]NHN36838.1 sulfotransferase [Pseudomaricurvus alcaniphilus]